MEETKKEAQKKNPQKKISKADKELFWVLGVMVGLILVFLISSAIFKDLKNFKYEGLAFSKEMFGDIPLYKHVYMTDKRMASTTGAVIGSDEVRSAVTVLLRNDPRENNILVEGKIEYPPREKFVYITFNSSGILCEYSNVAIASLGTFFNQNGFRARAGSADEADAKANNLTYVTCENKPDNMVIFFQAGSETSITRNENCYIITVANCEILPATEKFIVQSVIDAKENAVQEES
jgi:hypothetical protein